MQAKQKVAVGAGRGRSLPRAKCAPPTSHFPTPSSASRPIYTPPCNRVTLRNYTLASASCPLATTYLSSVRAAARCSRLRTPSRSLCALSYSRALPRPSVRRSQVRRRAPTRDVVLSPPQWARYLEMLATYPLFAGPFLCAGWRLRSDAFLCSVGSIHHPISFLFPCISLALTPPGPWFWARLP